MKNIIKTDDGRLWSIGDDGKPAQIEGLALQLHIMQEKIDNLAHEHEVSKALRSQEQRPPDHKPEVKSKDTKGQERRSLNIHVPVEPKYLDHVTQHLPAE